MSKTNCSNVIKKADLLGEPFLYPVDKGITTYKTSFGGFITGTLFFAVLVYILSYLTTVADYQIEAIIQYTEAEARDS